MILPSVPETLSAEQKRFIGKHLRQQTRLLEQGCPTCGHTGFDVDQTLRGMPSISPGGEVDWEYGSRYVEVACRNCSHIHLFHASEMGIPGLEGWTENVSP